MASSAERRFSIGVDYGTNSVRALVVDVADGAEVGTYVYNYPSGEAGILLDSKDPTWRVRIPPTISKGSTSRSNGPSTPRRKIRGSARTE